MRTIKIDGILSETSNYRQVRLVKVEMICPTCGVGTIPQKVYGVLYIPKSLGVPDSISISVKRGEKE